MASSVLSSPPLLKVEGDSALATYTRSLGSLPAVAKRPGSKVPVMMLLCNDEVFCRRYLPLSLRAVQIGLSHYGLAAHFYIYDNSTDKTAEIVRAFANDFPLTFVSEPLPACVPRGGAARSSARCNRIAACRNALIGMGMRCVADAPFALMVDSNIFASANVVVELANALLTDATVGVATACTASATNPAHYYDTYAYQPLDAQENHRIVGNVCPMRECPEQPCRTNRRWKWPTLSWTSEKPLAVASAFGGMAAVRSGALMKSRWRSAFDKCEHIAFCRDVRAQGYKVVIVPTAKALWVADLALAPERVLGAAAREIRLPVSAASAEKMWKRQSPKDDGRPAAPGRGGTPDPQRGCRPPAGRSVSVTGRRMRVPQVRQATQ